jgi:dihydroorotate dehydrogenase
MLDIMPAAGWRRKNDPSAGAMLYGTAVTVDLRGSYVPSPRYGNRKADGHTGDIFWIDDDTGEGVNSIGLKDDWGLDGLMENLPQMVSVAHQAQQGMKLRISFAGFDAEDFALCGEYLHRLHPTDRPDEIEYNFGCPNAGHGIISYSPDLVRECCAMIVDAMPQKNWISSDVKVSPFLNDNSLRSAVGLGGIVPFMKPSGPCIRAVVTSNTVPNIDLRDSEGRPRIAAEVMDGEKCGTIIHTGGGGGGDSMLAVACTEAKEWNDLLPSYGKLVLCGGLRTGEHAKQLILSGGGLGRVIALQVGTGFFHREDLQVFSDIATGVADLYE